MRETLSRAGFVGILRTSQMNDYQARPFLY